MKKLFQYLGFVFTLCVVVRIFSPVTNTNTLFTPSSPTPLSQVMNSLSPTPTPELHCLDEQKIQQVTGATYELTNENYNDKLKFVECSYEATNELKNLQPSIRYLLQKDSDQKIWQQTITQIRQKPSMRLISGKEYLTADINPVFEVAQGTFYGYTTELTLQLTYSPIQEEVGNILDKGTRLSDMILGK